MRPAHDGCAHAVTPHRARAHQHVRPAPGRPSPTLASHVMGDLRGEVPLVLDAGLCVCGLESSVLDGLSSPPVLLRPRSVTYEQLCGLPGMTALQVGGTGRGAARTGGGAE